MGLFGTSSTIRSIQTLASMVDAYMRRNQWSAVDWRTRALRPPLATEPMGTPMPPTSTAIVFVDASSAIHTVIPREPASTTLTTQRSMLDLVTSFRAHIGASVIEAVATVRTVNKQGTVIVSVVMDRYTLRRWWQFGVGKTRDSSVEAKHDSCELPFEEPAPMCTRYKLVDGVATAVSSRESADSLFDDLDVHVNPQQIRSHIRSGTRFSIEWLRRLQIYLQLAQPKPQTSTDPTVMFAICPHAQPSRVDESIRHPLVERAIDKGYGTTTPLSIDALHHLYADAIAGSVMAFDPSWVEPSGTTHAFAEADMLIPLIIRRILAGRDINPEWAKDVSLFVYSIDSDMFAALLYIGMRYHQMGGTSAARSTAVPVGWIQPMWWRGKVSRVLTSLIVNRTQGVMKDVKTWKALIDDAPDFMGILTERDDPLEAPTSQRTIMGLPGDEVDYDIELMPSCACRRGHGRAPYRSAPPKFAALRPAEGGMPHTVYAFDGTTGVPNGMSEHTQVVYINPIVSALDQSKVLGPPSCFLALVAANGTDFSGPTDKVSDGIDAFGPVHREAFFFYAAAQLREMGNIDHIYPPTIHDPLDILRALSCTFAFMSALPLGPRPTLAQRILALPSVDASMLQQRSLDDIIRTPSVAVRDGRVTMALPTHPHAFYRADTMNRVIAVFSTFAYWQSSLLALDGASQEGMSAAVLVRVHGFIHSDQMKQVDIGVYAPIHPQGECSVADYIHMIRGASAKIMPLPSMDSQIIGVKRNAWWF